MEQIVVLPNSQATAEKRGSATEPITLEQLLARDFGFEMPEKFVEGMKVRDTRVKNPDAKSAYIPCYEGERTFKQLKWLGILVNKLGYNTKSANGKHAVVFPKESWKFTIAIGYLSNVARERNLIK